mgnify:CR=1 FL=1
MLEGRPSAACWFHVDLTLENGEAGVGDLIGVIGERALDVAEDPRVDHLDDRADDQRRGDIDVVAANPALAHLPRDHGAERDIGISQVARDLLQVHVADEKDVRHGFPIAIEQFEDVLPEDADLETSNKTLDARSARVP